MNMPSHKELEVVDNPCFDRDYIVKVSIPEFGCVCPRTGLPDYAVIDIHYVPDKHIVELKSLKLYIVQYRSVGMYHEHVTNKIMDDFQLACRPKKIDVFGRFNPRGGICTTVEVHWP